MRATSPAFGGFNVTNRSKRAQLPPHLEGFGVSSAPNARNFPHIWRVLVYPALQTRATYLAFGGFWCIQRSKRAQLSPHLEGFGVSSAPNVRNLSRVWIVWTGVTLQTCATFPAFGGFNVTNRSKRAQLISRLESASVLAQFKKSARRLIWKCKKMRYA